MLSWYQCQYCLLLKPRARLESFSQFYLISSDIAVTVIWEVACSDASFNTFCQLWLETKENLVWFIAVIFYHHFPIWH